VSLIFRINKYQGEITMNALAFCVEQVVSIGVFGLYNAAVRASTIVNEYNFNNNYIFLKSKHLSPAQKEEINKIIFGDPVQRKKLFKPPEVLTFGQEINEAYLLKYTLKKIYTFNPGFDTNNFDSFKNASKNLKSDCIEAYRECLHSCVGLKLVEKLALAILEVNIKDDWRKDQWWLEKCCRDAALEIPLQDVSTKCRGKFHEILMLFNRQIENLFDKSPEIANQIMANMDSQELNNKAIEKTLEIYDLAEDAMLKMRGISW
jgi:hypothetical protein